ncbi:MAG: hydroxymethylbilane synthase [Desulfobacterales bacterium]
MMPGTVRIGTRGSKLALWQAEWVKSHLENLHSGLAVELTIIKTKGDKILDVPLAKVGGKGLFVKEIEAALSSGSIDLAVHSMKDMPAEIPTGLCIGAVPVREVPVDALITRDAQTLETLPRGARIGTSSLRRASQLRRARPDIEIVPLRGNLDTRLRKLDEGQMEAIVLAAAGVRRLGLEARISQKLDTEIMLPAVGQGALCIETRDGDTTIAPLVAPLEDEATRIAVTAERAYLHRLEGGCQVPIAGHATLLDGRLTLCGLVSDLEGQTVIKATQVGRPEEAETIGRELADHLLERGARAVLDRLQTE